MDNYLVWFVCLMGMCVWIACEWGEDMAFTLLLNPIFWGLALIGLCSSLLVVTKSNVSVVKGPRLASLVCLLVYIGMSIRVAVLFY